MKIQKAHERKFPLDLDWKEYCLIMALRYKFGHGDVVIVMRDFKVVRVKHAWTSDELEKPIDKK